MPRAIGSDPSACSGDLVLFTTLHLSMFSSAVLGGGFTSVAVLRALLDTSDDPHCCDVDGNARSAGGLAALQLALISGGSE